MLKNEDIAVVGAGLVGSLLAIQMARRGYSVDLFERRPDMRSEKISAGRSINLAISTRGLFALRQVGLEQEILKHAVPMKGRMIHFLNEDLAFQRYGKDDSQCIYSVSRGFLNQTLMTAAERTKSVRIHFNHRATLCKLNQRTLTLQDEKTGRSFEIQPKLLFGTDGSTSVVRQAIMGHSNSLANTQASESTLEYGYKELHIPPSISGKFQMEINALHIWPRGNHMLIALPNEDGSYTVTLFLPIVGPSSFESLNTPQKVEAFFQDQFRDARPLITGLSTDFFENPTGHMVTIKCQPWHWDDWALLLGDAAHAIVPFFGQGMNCGFEDCTVLDSMLAEKPLEGLFKKFSKARKPNADAIADMAVENFLEMRNKVANPQFLLEKEVEKILQKEFPTEYVSRYSLVSFSRVPYLLAQEIGSIQDRLLAELCDTLKSPQEVDLQRAHSLIQTRLAPIVGKDLKL